MSKWRTALVLLTSGSFKTFRRQLRIHFRQRRLQRAGSPFTYRLLDFPFICNPAIPDSANTFLTGDSDVIELHLLGTWLRPGSSFLDIGANQGVYLAAAAQAVGSTGICLGVEASPVLAAHLRASFSQMGKANVFIEEKAASDSIGEVVFYEARPGYSTGEQSLSLPPDRLDSYVACTVRQETLTSIVARHPRLKAPDMVKLDIEGGEPAALVGAPRHWFSANGPLWLVELNPESLARVNSSCGALASLFSPEAFERWLLPQYSHSNGCHLPPRPLIDTENFSDSRYYNLLALPRDDPRTSVLRSKLDK